MTNVVELSNKVYDRQTINKVVDRSFKEFGQKNVESVKTVEQFFQDYEDLYYTIAATGSSNSHQYLVEKSSLLYKMDEALMDIQPLLDEITTLRSQSVHDQQTIVELNTKIAELTGATNRQLRS